MKKLILVTTGLLAFASIGQAENIIFKRAFDEPTIIFKRLKEEPTIIFKRHHCPSENARCVETVE